VEQPQDVGLVALNLVQALAGAPVAIDPALDPVLAAPSRHVGVHVSEFVQDRALGSASMPTKTPADSEASAAGRPLRWVVDKRANRTASAATIRPLSSQWRAPRFNRRRRAQQRASHARPHLGVAAAVVEGAGRVIHRWLNRSGGTAGE